jgi:hypothetical protein
MRPESLLRVDPDDAGDGRALGQAMNAADRTFAA